jgi:hypothetical protein
MLWIWNFTLPPFHDHYILSVWCFVLLLWPLYTVCTCFVLLHWPLGIDCVVLFAASLTTTHSFFGALCCFLDHYTLRGALCCFLKHYTLIVWCFLVLPWPLHIDCVVLYAASLNTIHWLCGALYCFLDHYILCGALCCFLDHYTLIVWCFVLFPAHYT